MDNEKDLILIVIAGTLILVMLIFIIITFVVTYNNKMQKKLSEHSIKLKNNELELLKSVIETQETEREKIAANLHDEVGPLLSTLKLNVTRFKRALGKNELTAEQLENEKVFIDGIIDNVRTVSHDLTPHFLLKFGLSSAIKNFYSNLDEPSISITDDLNKEEVFSRTITLNSYRIILELLNNTIKHDQPTEIDIKLSKKESTLTIIIKHNGQGINNEQFHKFASESQGLGLNSIQSRVIILNANLDFETVENRGVVTLTIPVI